MGKLELISLIVALSMVSSGCKIYKAKKNLENPSFISGKVISEKFVEGETVSGGGIFSSGEIVKAPEYDRHVFLVKNSDGAIFSYECQSNGARIMDLKYSVGDSVDSISSKSFFIDHNKNFGDWDYFVDVNKIDD